MGWPHFHAISKQPWPFMVAIPAIFIIFTAVGWTRDNIVEDKVSKIWIPTEGSFAKDKNYANKYGREDLGSTSFLAMAIARDDGNLLIERRLESIRARMENTEKFQVSHKGVTYTWDDVCRSNRIDVGSSYEWPCIRLSPMDLFQEARWFMDERDRLTWYNDFLWDRLVRPRIPRFGVMQDVCGETYCSRTIRLRTDPVFAKNQSYPDGFATPMRLFSDIGNLEFSDPCRICYEEGFEAVILHLQSVITPLFQVMAKELNRTLYTTTPQERPAVADLLRRVVQIVRQMDRQAIEDYYFYSVTRKLYANLGAKGYIENYNAYMAQAGPLCEQYNSTYNLTCPPRTVSSFAQASKALLDHADNTFSSITTSGSPFPFWDKSDGTGNLFAGTMPVSGSGVDLKGNPLVNSTAYFDLGNYTTPEYWDPVYGKDGFANITSPEWESMVASDPVYKWFLSGTVKMTSHCGNGDLPGSIGLTPYFPQGIPAHPAQKWCTVYNVPSGKDGNFTQQHFARMFYDLLIDSPQFLGVTQGQSDAYVWTTGQACGYELGDSRDPYTNQSKSDILRRASRELYYIDEGESIGAIDRNLLIGGTVPDVNDYNSNNTLKRVGVMQSIYPALIPEDIVQRVKNCNRPGGPVNITLQDAEEILLAFKEGFEDTWSEGWDDDNSGEVQFVGYFDETGVRGTAGRVLKDITLSNGKLLSISVVIIAIVSVFFLASMDAVESRVVITLCGVALVLLAFFSALGFAIIVGIKINITTAWTLPFVIIGLGIDDVYIAMLALKRQRGRTTESFLKAMNDVAVPITMTSTVVVSMFAVMNISDVPAVFKTAQVALICVIFLYLVVMFSFPAYCYLDLRRQAAGRYDVLFWRKKEASDNAGEHRPADHPVVGFLYEKIYKPGILGEGIFYLCTHVIIWLGAMALFAVGIYGITERDSGLGLEDFFPYDHQGHKWATVRTEELASWPIGISWGALNYRDPDIQMRMVKQFEDVVDTPHVAEVDTNQLWIADFAVWTSRLCDKNFFRTEPEEFECGYNQEYVDPETGKSSFCTATWTENVHRLRLKTFDDPASGMCEAFEMGICRPTSEMHLQDLIDLGLDPFNLDNETKRKEWCPVINGWSDGQWKFCLQQWRKITNGGKGRLVLEDDVGTPTEECPSGDFYDDEAIEWPIPVSTGPPMFGFDLFTHEDTLDLIDQTRTFCDDNPDLHCWMTGIPYDYWSQYIGIFTVLVEIGGAAVAVGFGVAFLFLLGRLYLGAEKSGQPGAAIVLGSLVGAFLISVTTIVSLVSVAGVSILAGVSLTGFSNMAFVLSVGFTVEYSVHIVARWLLSSTRNNTAKERVEETMSFLMLPTFLSFVSSTIGVATLAFTKFEFNRIFFFRPLIIVMFVTYFYGCWWLPALLTLLDSDALRHGSNETLDEVTMTTTMADNKKIDPAAEVAEKEHAVSGGGGVPEAPEEAPEEGQSPAKPDVPPSKMDLEL